MSHNNIKKRTEKYKHNNQSHQHSYFWTIVLEKNQCGKIGAADEGLFIILQQQSLYNELFAEHRETSKKTPEIIFLHPLEKF